MITVSIEGLRAQNEQNGSHRHWAVVAAARKKVKDRVRLQLRATSVEVPCLVYVKLTRTGPRRMDDDGLRASLKSVRDAVAGYLRIDDGSSLIAWEYAQASGEYGVEIQIRWANE